MSSNSLHYFSREGIPEDDIGVSFEVKFNIASESLFSIVVLERAYNFWFDISDLYLGRI